MTTLFQRSDNVGLGGLPNSLHVKELSDPASRDHALRDWSRMQTPENARISASMTRTPDCGMVCTSTSRCHVMVQCFFFQQCCWDVRKPLQSAMNAEATGLSQGARLGQG